MPVVTLCESYPLTDGLTASLSRLRQSGKLGGQCTALLSSTDYQFLSIEAPNLPATAPASELKEAVRWKIKDMVNFSVAEAGIDILKIPTAPGRPAQLLAAAAPHTALRPLIQGFQAAKVSLTAIDLPELAQRNIARLFEVPDRALALLIFSDQGGLLTFTCNGELYAIRRIDISASELAGGDTAGIYDRVVLDVQRSLDNFDRNFSQLSLERLLVLPVPGADGLIQHLKDNLYQKVAALNISEGLDISAVPMLSNSATLADALPVLGAALHNEASA
jgi:MSHA biogenesis protein MshI